MLLTSDSVFVHSRDLSDRATGVRIAVVVPAYKCAKQIGPVLNSIPQFINHIIVVDDASPDHIEVEVNRVEDERLIYIRHEQNQGVGGAMLTGYEKAIALGVEIILKIDGDGQMNVNDIPSLIRPVLDGRADYAKGNRFFYPHYLNRMPRLRLIGNIGLTFLAKVASGYWNIFDPTNGFTVIHRDVLRLLNKDHIYRRYFFESSLLIELNRVRAVVVDIPIPARYGDEESSLSVLNAFFEFPMNLFKGLMRRIYWQYFLYDFTAVSLFLILGTLLTMVGGLWGIYHWYISIRYDLVATTGTVMLAVLPIILGFQLLLQAIVLDIQNIPTTPIQKRNSPLLDKF